MYPDLHSLNYLSLQKRLMRDLTASRLYRTQTQMRISEEREIAEHK